MSSRPFVQHAAVLILCSVVSFIGHYLQFGIARLTPWIPANAGIIIGLTATLIPPSRLRRWTLLAMTTAFGLLTVCMCLRFWPQHYQPLRKKLVFTAMSASACVCLTRAGLGKRARRLTTEKPEATILSPKS